MSNLVEEQAFINAIDEENTYLSILAKDSMISDELSWSDLAIAGRNNLLKDMFDIGDQFTDTWKDTAANAEYTYPYQLNHICDAELEDGTIIHGAYYQAHWAHPFGVQFSHQRAFLACPNGMAAGTYYFTIDQDWGTYVKNNDIVCFTLTKSVPAGGRLAGCYGAPDQAKSNWRIYSYAANGIDLLETVIPTFAASGTNLGVMHHNTRNGNLNSVQEMAYGLNAWAWLDSANKICYSALCQYLNSDRPKGQWWTAQDQWDIAPDQLASKDGFLRGCSDDFVNSIRPVKCVTYLNTVNEGGREVVTYHKVTIPSLEQMYIGPQIAGEGEFHEYWRRRSGRTSKMAQWGTYPNIITYAVENHTSAQYVRLRSAYRGYANVTWLVYSSGNVNCDYASDAIRFSPLVFIG